VFVSVCVYVCVYVCVCVCCTLQILPCILYAPHTQVLYNGRADEDARASPIKFCLIADLARKDGGVVEKLEPVSVRVCMRACVCAYVCMGLCVGLLHVCACLHMCCIGLFHMCVCVCVCVCARMCLDALKQEALSERIECGNFIGHELKKKKARGKRGDFRATEMEELTENQDQ